MYIYKETHTVESFSKKKKNTYSRKAYLEIIVKSHNIKGHLRDQNNLPTFKRPSRYTHNNLSIGASTRKSFSAMADSTSLIVNKQTKGGWNAAVFIMGNTSNEI